jgi:hypothetical protein
VLLLCQGGTRFQGVEDDAGQLALEGADRFFHVAGDLESAWVAAAAIAASLWGEMMTVGYDSGDSLDAAHRGGFKSIGELVVADRREIATTPWQFLLPIVTTYLVPGFVP